MLSSDVTTRKLGSYLIISFLHVIMLTFSVSFRHGGCFDITLKVLIIPFQTVCFMFGAGNIHTNKEEKRVKENVLVNPKFQIISLVVSRTCELDEDPPSLLFLHWLCRFRINLLPLRGLSFKRRFLQVTVLTEIKAGVFCVDQNPCWSENAICKQVYTRTHWDCCKWNTLHFTQASSLK